MSHELVLTSVLHGLEPDSSGFCPVAADRGISLELTEYLTALSRYRHCDTLSPPDNRHNPVCYSHVIHTDANMDKPRHVLSRICDAGTDYQQCPNTLAHHIAVDTDEQNPEGPAWLLSLPGFHLTEWITPPVRFPVARSIPRLIAPPSLTRRQQIARERRWCDPLKMVLVGREFDSESTALLTAIRQNDEQIAIAGPPVSPCPAWQEVTGDAGWGGILAETVLTGQRVAIIISPQQNLLPLYVEALSLLPVSALWRGTFSTYYTGLPKQTVCQWKGCVAGTPEAERFSQDSTYLVLDLTKELGAAPSGSYVEFARQGVDYLLPDKETTDTFFQSLLDSDTKPYEAGEEPVPLGQDAPTERKLLSVAPATIQTPPRQRQYRRKPSGLFGLLLDLKSRGQFYFLYSVMLLLIITLFVMLLDQTLHWGLISSLGNQSEEMMIDQPVDRSKLKPVSPIDDEPKPEPGTESDPSEKPAVQPVAEQPQKIVPEPPSEEPIQSELDGEKPVAEDNVVQVPAPMNVPALTLKQIKDAKVGDESGQYAIPFTPEIKEFYNKQELPPVISVLLKLPPNWKCSVANIQDCYEIDIETGKQSKIILDDGKEEFSNPVYLTLAVEIDGSKIVWKDLFVSQIKDLKALEHEILEQRDHTKSELDKLQRDAFNAPSEISTEKDKLNEAIRQHENRLSEIKDYLEKLPSAYDQYLKTENQTDTQKIEFKVFFDNNVVLETK